jgi:hypothetical protein
LGDLLAPHRLDADSFGVILNSWLPRIFTALAGLNDSVLGDGSKLKVFH